MTRSSGSTEDRESDIITSASGRLMVCIPQYKINRLNTSIPRRIASLIDVWSTHTSYKQPWVNNCLETGNRNMQECVILRLFMTKLFLARTSNFVRAFKSILFEYFNKNNSLLILYQILLLMVPKLCPYYLKSLQNFRNVCLVYRPLDSSWRHSFD